MKWVKIWVYIFTYLVLLFAAKSIFIGVWGSISNMFGSIQTTNELNAITSIIVELLTWTIILILFFIPLGWSQWRKSLNLHYYIDRVYSAIEDFALNNNQNRELKKQRLLSLIYNIFIYWMIMIAYIILLVQIGEIRNWLEILWFLLFTYILISWVDFITSIIMKLDESESDTSNTDYISKKNLITFIMLIVIFSFLYFGIPLVETVYKITFDLPVFSLFDWNRINIK